MGLFDKLFGKKDNSSNGSETSSEITIPKTSQLLEEDLYWSIIANSLANSEDQDEQEEFLVNEINKMTPEQMIGFKLRTDQLLLETYTSEMWCAGFIMNGGCSDDGFDYFRNWVISRGREVYYNAKANPDSLISEVDNQLEGYDFEGFGYVANDAFDAKTGKDLYDYIDESGVNSTYPEIEFNWEEEEPETMREICPRLFAELWED